MSQDRINKIRNWANKHRIGMQVIAGYQVRLRSGKLIMDVFPKSLKYHDINTGERGVLKYHKCFTEYLDEHFNTNEPCTLKN